ncbi:MAG: sulfite exporter TauE/SafE family protein [Phycisphaerae bacterium]
MAGAYVQLAGAFGAAFLAGAINSVAGGGSLISFPALVALGLPPVAANATNTVGIWPGSVGSVWGFRRELGRVPPGMLWLLVPGALGGMAGAVLLRYTPAGVFDRLVPWLILLATALFMVQGPVQKKLRSVEAAGRRRRRWWFAAIMVQLAVSVYGGYFGAGMSIMMLSVLGLLGMTDILEMNAMTSLLSLSINGVAGVLFMATGLVSWPHAVAMALGAVVGGYGATGAARKVGKVWIRRFVMVVGVGITVAMFWRMWRG